MVKGKREKAGERKRRMVGRNERTELKVKGTWRRERERERERKKR